MRFLFFFLFIFPLFAARVPGKVTICGVCKDVEMTMPFTISNLETIGKLFDDYRIFIYENNSKDATPQLLQAWAAKNPKVRITSEIIDDELLKKSCVNVTIQNTGSRTELIARARNIVLDQIMAPLYDDFGYVIWVDLDFEQTFPFEAIVKTFQSQEEWDAVFANGVSGRKKRHFDLFAFRDHKHPLGPEFLGNIWWKMWLKQPFNQKQNVRLRVGDPWYPVYSAFGGMGIYKRKSIRGCRYCGYATEDLEELAKTLIKNKKNSQIDFYLQQMKVPRTIIRIHEIRPEMTAHHNLECGILLGTKPNGLIFRMNSGVCQYPSACEHVTFHASMILRGHDKLFINPDLMLYYKR